jgi:hypothetical protein
MGADVQHQRLSFYLVRSLSLTFIIKMYNTQSGDAASPFRNYNICEIKLDSFDKIKVAVFLGYIRVRNGWECSGRRHGMTIPNAGLAGWKVCCAAEFWYDKGGGQTRSTLAS